MGTRLLQLWESIKPVVGPLLWALGAAAAFCAIAGWFATFPVQVAIANVIFIIIVVVALVWVISKEKKKTSQLEETFSSKLRLISERLHTVHHLIRDETYRLGEAPESARLNALHAVGQILNLMSDFLGDLTGQKICVCIKIMEQFEGITAEKPSDLEGKTVLTFVRDAGTPRKRWEHLRHPLSHNSDFRDIILGQKSYFTAVDLEKESGYTNTTSDWSVWYKTAIVVPIQLDVAQKPGGHPRFELLGFLCADSMSIEAFGDRIEDYANLLMSVGDGLYHYFDHVRNCALEATSDKQDQ
ncbi:MAG: hypothetical protein WCG29_13645 [Desulfomonile sp.]|nr:hypothetical protein [Deltaproteobacteria bacterium]